MCALLKMLEFEILPAFTPFENTIEPSTPAPTLSLPPQILTHFEPSVKAHGLLWHLCSFNILHFHSMHSIFQT